MIIKTFIAALLMTFLIFGCSNVTTAPEEAERSFDIALIVDGTDVLSQQNGIPIVAPDSIVALANKLHHKGTGTLYVGYIDRDCDNNHVVVFNWTMTKPLLAEKKVYQPNIEYNENRKKYEVAMYRFDSIFSFDSITLYNDCKDLLSKAYSDAVASDFAGSDIHGAINQACKLLQSNNSSSNSPSYIILVSDGVDNVGKILKPLPDDIQLLIVNTNSVKHQLQLDVVEYATLNQAINHIF